MLRVNYQEEVKRVLNACYTNMLNNAANRVLEYVAVTNHISRHSKISHVKKEDFTNTICRTNQALHAP